ncbi:low-density lipoprotein receptor-related protein 2-like [Tigriopus californicus]|uniref:low-density lipoprotein receptor-related protein 2-like n=1 Tax=Tigriopus californicus TaxID=6832 RepID=UPI0027DA4F33|nr:low-density lipoprotein receptor-related protein 2-like [Tigriopus californicus]
MALSKTFFLLGLILMLEQQVMSEVNCTTRVLPTPLCDETYHQVCDKEQDASGCPTGKFCFPKSTPDGCSLSCPKFCRDSETYCVGRKPSPNATCNGPDSCVPRVEVTSGCPNYCTPECDAGQRVCTGVRTATNPCMSPPTCVPTDQNCPGDTHDQNGCPLSTKPEPASCPDGQILCSNGVDAKGCNLGKECKTPIASSNDQCPKICPVACSSTHQVTCPQTYDFNGCPKAPKCAPSLMSCPQPQYAAITGCPIMKEPDCDLTTQQQCHQEPIYKHEIPGLVLSELFEPYLICMRPGICQPKHKPGTFCPFLCEKDCRVISENGTSLVTLKKCDGLFTNRGCQTQNYCEEKQFPCQEQTFDERGCAIHPTVQCASHEEKCEGTYDQNGCQASPTCIPKDSACACPTSDYDNLGCPKLVKDVTCADNQQKCAKDRGDNDCDMGYMCAPKQVDGCSVPCPLYCPSGQISCATAKDGNCVTKKGCQSAMLTETGKTHCMNVCPLFCPSGQENCTTYNNHGCPLFSCVANATECHTDYDSNGCQTMVDPECNLNTHRLCPLGTDENGCTFGKTCTPKDAPCPVACNHALERECSRGVWHGDKLGNYCVSKTKESDIYRSLNCEAACPVACDWATEKACSNGFEITTGCPKADACQSKRVPCAEPLDRSN